MEKEQEMVLCRKIVGEQKAADQSCRPAPGQDLLYLSTPWWVFPGTELCSGCTHQHYRRAEPGPAATATPLPLLIQEKTHPHPVQPPEFQASSRTLLIACLLCLLGEDRLSNAFIWNSKMCTHHTGGSQTDKLGLSGQVWPPTGGHLSLGLRGTFRLQAVQPVGDSCADPPH